MLKKDWVFRRGDIYMANLTPVCGSEQGGVSPVLVIQNNVGNYHYQMRVSMNIIGNCWQELYMKVVIADDREKHEVFDS